jgi:hypothetical protein
MSTTSPYLFRDVVANARAAAQRLDFVDSRALHAAADDTAPPAVDFAPIQPLPTLEDQHPWLIDLYVWAGVAAVMLSAAYPYWVQP